MSTFVNQYVRVQLTDISTTAFVICLLYCVYGMLPCPRSRVGILFKLCMFVLAMTVFYILFYTCVAARLACEGDPLPAENIELTSIGGPSNLP